ncbi:MAG: adenylate/guanylate cyclase domain-containing protein, partial [Acidimicrobiales bacterium]
MHLFASRSSMVAHPLPAHSSCNSTNQEKQNITQPGMCIASETIRFAASPRRVKSSGATVGSSQSWQLGSWRASGGQRMLPEGTVTFLLTDVEGSTRLWEAEPEAMADVIARHYELLDRAIAAHGGQRPQEQGEGDSVVAVFSDAAGAVAAAIDAQRLLAVEPFAGSLSLRVRMALHSGVATKRDALNYAGPVVIRCARLRACGHGGQILISEATAALVRDRLPPQVALVGLGLHQLKDLDAPERVSQVVVHDLPASFPALRSLVAEKHNLPTQPTPLIGRASEIA